MSGCSPHRFNNARLPLIDGSFKMFSALAAKAPVAPKDKSILEKIQAPVFGFYGENDARVNASIPETEEKMAEYGKTYEPVIFEGGGHGFMRSGEGPDASEGNKKAREAGWKRLINLLSDI